MTVGDEVFWVELEYDFEGGPFNFQIRSGQFITKSEDKVCLATKDGTVRFFPPDSVYESRDEAWAAGYDRVSKG